MDRPAASPDVLIDELTRDLRPVRVRSRRFVALGYGLTLALLGGAFLAGLGTAPGALAKVGHPDSALALAALVLSIGAGSLALALYSRPGAPLPRVVRALFLAGLGISCLIQLARVLTDGAGSGAAVDEGWRCGVAALAMATVAASVLVVQMRREAPVRLMGATFSLLFASGALAALVLTLHCPNGNPWHELVWHLLLPLALLGLSARAVSRRALGW